MKVPQADLQGQYSSLKNELDASIASVLAHGRFINGPEVESFERNFAEYCGAKHCVGTSSGTSALEVALRAMKIGPGDEVITTTSTFFATVEAIMNVGATPVLVDVDYDTALMTPELVEPSLTKHTKAIIVVHLYGQPVDLAAFRALADRKNLLLVEDAAQAHGATSDGITVGSSGDLATFSFFPGKNLGAFGDAGGITANDSALAARARKLRDHGRTDKYLHGLIGTNARLDSIQAGVLDVKLTALNSWNSARQENAEAYDKAFADLPGVNPLQIAPGRRSVYHQYVIRVPERETIMASLEKKGISTGIHYPVPVHLQPAIEAEFGKTNFPVSERLANEVVSIPVHPELSKDQRDHVIAAISEYAYEERES